MSTATQSIDESKLEQFAERVAADQNAGVAAVLAYIGDRLGIWTSLAGVGWTTAEDLARRAGFDPGYLAEWLAAQAAAEYVEFDAASGRYRLPAEHALVLADEDSPVVLAGGFEFQAGCWADADRVADLFVTGDGLAWADRDPRLGNGAARFFRPLYRECLVDPWLTSLDGVVPRLQEGARVVDVGCGQGYATSLLADSFPESRVVGIDRDEPALDVARRHATDAGLDNLEFRAGTADDLGDGAWDLVCYFDAFHHLGDPSAAAHAARRALRPGGTLVLVEPLSRDSVDENLMAAGPLYYGPSTVLCLPDARSQDGDVALGAQAGPAAVLSILQEAGFEARVASETDFNLVIEAR